MGRFNYHNFAICLWKCCLQPPQRVHCASVYLAKPHRALPPGALQGGPVDVVGAGRGQHLEQALHDGVQVGLRGVATGGEGKGE